MVTAVGEPAAVIRPETAEGVAEAVVLARDHRLVLSVRGGGHSGGGFGTNRGGLVIDLRRLNRVVVTDQAAGLVEVGGGAVWEEVARALVPQNLALSSGDTRSVGVGGLTLGGGVGWMVRQYGLMLDRLLECQVVLADGQIVTVSRLALWSAGKQATPAGIGVHHRAVGRHPDAQPPSKE